MTSITPAALPAASNIVSLKTLAEHDRDVLQLLLDRLIQTSAAAVERLQTRPKKLKIPDHKDLSFHLKHVAKSEIERLQWQVYLELDFLGALAQELKKRQPKPRRKGGAK